MNAPTRTTRAEPGRPLPRRSRGYGANTVQKSLVGSTPRNVGPELNGVVAFPRDFVPLLRPDGPYYGSGL